MIPERLATADPCELMIRWLLDPDLAHRAVRSAQQFEEETRRRVDIISGFRTEALQDTLRARGRPTAPNDRSTHLTCPATGMDISLFPLPTKVMKVIWGRIVVFEGLRWGGDSPIDPGTGIPSDWAHIDLGPRAP